MTCRSAALCRLTGDARKQCSAGQPVNREGRLQATWAAAAIPISYTVVTARLHPRALVTSSVPSALRSLWNASISFSGNSQMTSLWGDRARTRH